MCAKYYVKDVCVKDYVTFRFHYTYTPGLPVGEGPEISVVHVEVHTIMGHWRSASREEFDRLAAWAQDSSVVHDILCQHAGGLHRRKELAMLDAMAKAHPKAPYLRIVK